MQRHFITGLLVFMILSLQSFVMMLRPQPAGGNSAEAAGGVGQRQRPKPTPRPTPRQNINGGGGVSERGNANDSSNRNRPAPGVLINERRRPRSRIVPDIPRPHGNVNTNSNSKVGGHTVRENPADVFLNDPSTRRGRPGVRPRRSAPARKLMRAGRETSLSTSTCAAVIPEPPADFSGTYTGRVSDEAHGTTDEEAILTVNGNRYTLTSASLNYSGRFVVHTNRGYHAVIMELGPPPPGRLFATFISVRARRPSPRGFILTSVAGERRRFSFIGRGAKGDL